MSGMNLKLANEYIESIGNGNQPQQERGVYAEFSQKAKKIAESGDNGLPVYDDRVWVEITPAGGNTITTRWATEKDISRFQMQYTAFMKGVESPAEGLGIENWPSATPAEVKMLKQANVRTVEDLALLSESGLKNVGFGSRGLQNKARQFLAAAADSGKLAAEMHHIETELESLKLRNAELERQNDELRAQARTIKETPHNSFETPPKFKGDTG